MSAATQRAASLIGDAAKRLLHNRGLQVARVAESRSDVDQDFYRYYEQCLGFTMTSFERMYALYGALLHICKQDIPGDFVECGVWRGGSSMLAALVLKDKGLGDRALYLYDTYAGMTEPSRRDRTSLGMDASSIWATRQRGSGGVDWCRAGLSEVQHNMESTEYSRDLLTFVVGRVEDTIPDKVPDAISLLRLDTDWYESTLHELEHLYPRLASGGILIIDDYGCWEGAKEATDEYLASLETRPFLARIDSSCRVCVKP